MVIIYTIIGGLIAWWLYGFGTWLWIIKVKKLDSFQALDIMNEVCGKAIGPKWLEWIRLIIWPYGIVQRLIVTIDVFRNYKQ